jgi:hypothetical protein
MTEMHKQALTAEIASLLAHGMEHVTVKEFYRRYDEAGFRFDHRDTIRQFARWMTGPRAGEVSPCTSMNPIHKETGLGYAHIDLPRSETQKVQTMRNQFFAVSRGYILEI